MLQPLQFGKYLLLERIAVGGMAEVFVAKAFGVEGFERLLAIKKILPTMGEDNEFNTMFVDEARIAVQLAHANIVQVLELGKVDDNLFIAMEYISGRDVRQLLERFRKRGRPMPIPQACTIVAKVCEALDYAHRKRDARGTPLGIVHRDVSPQNVLVSFEGDVKLIDFGIAKAESRLQRTQAGILKGKFSYMSPEQVRGQAIDHRSDVFAVGVLLWELLCGEKLFTGDSDFAVLEKVRTGQIPLPRKVNPDIPEPLERVMMKALATEVRDRYQWASELHDALVRFTLIGDMVYGSRQLAEWMREEFHLEFEKEQKRLRSWLGISDAEVEVTPSDPMRRKPLPRMPSDLQQQMVQPPQPPAPPMESEPEPLVQAPTPTGVRHRVPASKTATPPPGELRPVARPASPPAQPPPLPPAEDLSHELPTMKMDGNALAAAEKALAEQRAKAGEARAFGVDDEESTVREDGPAAREAKAKAEAQAARQAESARLLDERPPSSPGASAPPPRPITLKDRPTAPRLPASLDPALLAGERLQPLPIQRVSPQPPPPPPISAPPLSPPPPADAFDVSEERTAAPRAQRTGALSKPIREEKPLATADARNNIRRNLLLAASVLLASLGAAWFLWPSEIAAPGRLVLALTPSVPAELIIDGKPAGAIPPFVWQLSRGPHRVEIHASGFKPFTASVRISSPSKPTELAVALVSDAPMEVEGVILNQNQNQNANPGAPEVVPREPTRPRWLTGKQPKEDEAKTPEPAPAPINAPVAEAPARRAAPQPAPAPAPPAGTSPDALAPPRAPRAADSTRAPDSAKLAAADPAAALKPPDDPTRLKVNTTPPGADIVIDGQSVGKSPVTVPGLDTAMVHIVAVSLAGYKPERRVAKASDDGRFNPLALALQALPSAAVAPPPASGSATLPAPGTSAPGFSTTTATATPPPAIADTESSAGPIGYLVTMTKPVAKVYIDGKDTGRWTPVVPKYPISLAPGPHTVTFETTEGHKHDETITIEAGKTSRVIKMDL